MLSSNLLLDLPHEILEDEIFSKLSANELLKLGKSNSDVNRHARATLLHHNKLSYSQWHKLLQIWTIEPARAWVPDEVLNNTISKFPRDIYLDAVLRLFFLVKKLSHQNKKLVIDVELMRELLDKIISHGCSSISAAKLIAVLMPFLSDEQVTYVLQVTHKNEVGRTLLDALSWRLNEDQIAAFMIKNNHMYLPDLLMYRFNEDQIEKVYQNLLKYFEYYEFSDESRLDERWAQFMRILNHFDLTPIL